MKNKEFCNKIEKVRANSRGLVRELGFLEDKNSLIGVSLAQTHILLELSSHGELTAAQLAVLLRVNKSSSTRSIQKLREQGWVQDSKDTQNKRQRPVELTNAGEEKVKSINGVCDDLISTALGFLDPEQQTEVGEGLELFYSALRKVRSQTECVIRPIRRQDDESFSALIFEVLKEFKIESECSPAQDPEVAAMHSHYTKNGCTFFIAERNKKLLGGAGIAPLLGASPEVCELKKLYLLPEARGLGIGSRLINSCLLAAKERGYRRVFLETTAKFESAIALFEKSGFTQRKTPLGHSKHQTCELYYERIIS